MRKSCGSFTNCDEPQDHIDTSTLIGAALRRGSVPHRALVIAFEENEVCVSAELISELRRVLLAKKFERYLPHVKRVEFVEYLQRRAQMHTLQAELWSTIQRRCRDKNDDHLLVLAQSARANTLVTSDGDLIVLNPWNHVSILRPAEFLDRESLRVNREVSPEDVP